MMKSEHRVNLALPKSLYGEIQEAAESANKSIPEFMRDSIRFYLFITQQIKPNGSIYLEQDGKRDRVLIL